MERVNLELNNKMEEFLLQIIDTLSEKKELTEADIKVLNAVGKLYHEHNDEIKSVAESMHKLDSLEFEKRRFEVQQELEEIKHEHEKKYSKKRFMLDVACGIAIPLAITAAPIAAEVAITRSAYRLETAGGIPPRWLSPTRAKVPRGFRLGR